MKDLDITTIAKEAGVSVATVSRVINNEHGVSDEVRRKTLDFIEKNGYRPRANSKRGTRLGVVMEEESPDFDGFFSRILTGIFSYASEENVETTLVHYVPGKNSEVSIAEYLRRKRCNGALFMASSRSDLGSLVEARIPTMLLANRSNLPEVGYIDCDCYTGALEQMHYLFRLGHRRIGYLSAELKGFVDHQERLVAYQDALKSFGIPVEESWVIEYEPGQTELAGYAQAKKLLAAHPDVTAIFACNDAMACGAICACVESGRQVPRDISVVGFDDNPTSRFYNPPLTTIRQPLREMGYEAAKFLDRKLKGKVDELPKKF